MIQKAERMWIVDASWIEVTYLLVISKLSTRVSIREVESELI
jgi:hypothetical protein